MWEDQINTSGGKKVTKLCGQEVAPGVHVARSLATQKLPSEKVGLVSHDLPEN